MSKIYVLWKDARRVISVFDDRSKLDWFLNGHGEKWSIEEYEVNDTGDLRVFNVYYLVLHLDPLELINYSLRVIPTYLGYYKCKDKSENIAIFEVQADSLDEAIERAKSHARQ